MRALILSQYFTPELTAGAARVHAFARALAERGDDVEVVCEVPSHPRGVIDPGYRGRALQRRRVDGFEARYVWVPTSPRKTPVRRLANYGGYALAATVVGAAAKRPDVVLASSPPLTVGLAGALAAVRHRVPWVLDVRDLWPSAAVAVGELRGERLIAATAALERRLYVSASLIVTPSRGSLESIGATGGDPGKVELIASGTTREWLDLGEREVGRAGVGYGADEFVWCYAGNVGLAQDLETAVRAAGRLGERFRLVVVGDGPRRAEVEELAAREAPDRVTFTGLLPRERAAEHLRAADATLVSLAPAPGIAYAVPSKLYDCCAVGRPVIVAAAGEAERLAREEEIAVAVPPGDPEALAAAVAALRDDPARAAALAERGRDFAAEHLRDDEAGRLAELLHSLAR